MDEEIKENMASVTECVFGILEEIKNINKNIDLLIKAVAEVGLSGQTYFPTLQNKAISMLERLSK